MIKLITVVLALWLSLNVAGQSNNQTLQNIDRINLSLGDKLFLEVQLDSGKHLSFVRGSKRSDKSKTITINIKYNDATGTMLEIINPFDKDLTYKAEIYSYKKADFIETSVIPISAKLSSFETWPYKIDKLRLTNFAFSENAKSSQ